MLKLPAVQLLLERLNNDITRLAAVKAVEQIAMAPLPLPLGSMLGPSMQLLTSFLRKSSRPLRQASLCAIKVSVWYTQCSSGHVDRIQPWRIVPCMLLSLPQQRCCKVRWRHIHGQT